MIDLQSYRLRIGSFNQIKVKLLQRFYGQHDRRWKTTSGKFIDAVWLTKISRNHILLLVGIVWLLRRFYAYTDINKVFNFRQNISSFIYDNNFPFMVVAELAFLMIIIISFISSSFNLADSDRNIVQQGNPYRFLSKKMGSNFKAKYTHGNIERGLKNIHLNVRSLYNKMSELKSFTKKEKPHIMGVSEAEIFLDWHERNSLEIPGYNILFPKSWNDSGKARVLVYVKKCLQFKQIFELESEEVQSIWLKAGFKNCKQVFYSHVYREHTSTMGNSIASQRVLLNLILKQWEEAIHFENNQGINEVHVAGDFNLDSLNGRWLNSDYSLVSLARMVKDFCNANGFDQLVNEVTRIQYNSILNKTQTSCIDHLYCNARHRISPVKVITFGSSDHDAISYVRYSREPKAPSRTIRKRSYKNFIEKEFLSDIASLDFTDVYTSLDVDLAANLLTQKLVSVLDIHAPWVVFQHRKNYLPWLTDDTISLMKERDRVKEEAKVLASSRDNCNVQSDLWKKYKVLRNKVNNRLKNEEVIFKRKKFHECKEYPDKVWGLAKNYMNWTTSGPPLQLEVDNGGSFTLVTKAVEIAQVMNTYFIDKVQRLSKSMSSLTLDLGGCLKIMDGKRLSFSLEHVTVRKVQKLLYSLKSKRSTSVDQLDNYSVRLAAKFIARPLHHVITLSIMQNKFPSNWKYTKLVPLHKKQSRVKKENYRPVAILSPLSKVLEKVMFVQLYGYFDRNKLFDPSLHGYRTNRSTMSALLSMYDKWAMAASKGQVSGIVLADLSAAFDLVAPHLLEKKLRIYGVKEDTITWLLSYLTNRYQAVWIDHAYSEFLEHSIGVPQGSNLGPLLFLIFFNDLPTFINGNIECYADDSTMSATGKNLSEIKNILTEDCEAFSRWMRQNSFKLNVDKTNLMVVGTTARLERTPSLQLPMDNNMLKEGTDKKESLLGIIIQSNLKWSAQIENLCHKLKTRLAALSKLRRVMNKSSKLVIVQGMFQSVLCYCLPLFGGCSKLELNSLQVLQNSAVRIALNLPPRAHRNYMYDMVGWLTVKQLVAYHTCLAVYRIRKSQQPEHLATLLLNENYRGNIIVKNVQLELYRSSFIFRGSVLWNNLPGHLRQETSERAFKKNLSKWIKENISRFEG